MPGLFSDMRRTAIGAGLLAMAALAFAEPGGLGGSAVSADPDSKPLPAATPVAAPDVSPRVSGPVPSAGSAARGFAVDAEPAPVVQIATAGPMAGTAAPDQPGFVPPRPLTGPDFPPMLRAGP